MKLVADTNIFLASVLNEPEKSGIVKATTGHELVAPEILPYELGNALSAALKRGRLNSDQVLLAYEKSRAIPVELRPVDIARSLEIAAALNIYAYDAYFLECALNLRAPLLTLDEKMRQVAGDLGIRILEIEP